MLFLFKHLLLHVMQCIHEGALVLIVRNSKLGVARHVHSVELLVQSVTLFARETVVNRHNA